MRIESILPTSRKRLSTIQAHAAVSEAAKLLSNTHISLVVVCDANEVMVGVVTKTDVVRQIVRLR
jgi:predicted transcriptional regulator